MDVELIIKQGKTIILLYYIISTAMLIFIFFSINNIKTDTSDMMLEQLLAAKLM